MEHVDTNKHPHDWFSSLTKCCFPEKFATVTSNTIITKPKKMRRHVSLLDDNGVVIEPMEGWTREQTTALIHALREIPAVPCANKEREHALQWQRMVAVSHRVEGKDAVACSKCAEYVAERGVGYFARSPSRQH